MKTGLFEPMRKREGTTLPRDEFDFRGTNNKEKAQCYYPSKVPVIFVEEGKWLETCSHSLDVVPARFRISWPGL